MWHYTISTGILTDGTRVIHCYSGAFGIWLNNPLMISEPMKGPIPVGFYDIGPSFHDAAKGAFAMHLTPDPANDMFGRSAFMLHADSIRNPGHASEGCIVSCSPAAMLDREYVANSPIKRLQVAA